MMASMHTIPVVDEIFVDGRRIPILCRRNYEEAKADYWAATAKPLPDYILPLNSATKVAKVPEVNYAG